MFALQPSGIGYMFMPKMLFLTWAGAEGRDDFAVTFEKLKNLSAAPTSQWWGSHAGNDHTPML